MTQKRRLPDFRTWSTAAAIRRPLSSLRATPRPVNPCSKFSLSGQTIVGNPILDPRDPYGRLVHDATDAPAQPPAAAASVLPGTAVVAICIDTGVFRRDLVVPPPKMSGELLQGIELEQGLALIRGEGEAVRHAQVRRDVQGRAAAARGMAAGRGTAIPVPRR